MNLENNSLLHIDEVSKRFGGVQALDRVSFDIMRGEVHALVGENGAGKSTLMKIIFGMHRKDSGSLILDGVPYLPQSPADAMNCGIAMIPQEVTLFNHISIAENLCICREPKGSIPGTINWPKVQNEARNLLNKVGLQVNPKMRAGRLSAAQKQMIVIARALGFQSKLLLLDEPTSALTFVEAGLLFKLLENLKALGVSILYVSHKLQEVFAISDRITVLRDGQKVSEFITNETNPDEVIQMMIGRQITSKKRERLWGNSESTLLEVKNVYRKGHLYNINMTVRHGEIVGLFGLVGAGRTELARAIFGRDKLDRGDIYIESRKIKIYSPTDSLRNGIGLLPENRKDEGIMMNLSVRDNITVGILNKLSRFGILNKGAEQKAVKEIISTLNIRTPSDRQKIVNLSGGNQQKVVLGRWLLVHPKLLILDEPTHGIDVGTKAEIHKLMDKLSQGGVGILFISSELPELLGFCDRIFVFHEGKIISEFDGSAISEETVMTAILQLRNEHEVS